ncbi:MAG: hypothetical protein HXS44_08705 [Theionarchaea archaeon]|nr:hypothetical protein [Theionarchaea archaeon]
MEKKYRYLIAGAALVAIIISSVCIAEYSTGYFRDRFQERFEGIRQGQPQEIELRFPEQREAIRRMLEFVSLEEEEAEQAKQIAQSDEVVHAILQVIGDAEVSAYRGPNGTAILRYSSDKDWILQAAVNMKTERVESVTANRGVLTLVLDPREIVQIAEKEFSQKEFGMPVLRRVAPSGEDAEVVFLTDKGAVTVRVDLEERKVISLREEAEEPFFQWLWIIWGVLLVAVVAVIVAAVMKGRKKSQEEPLDEGDIQGDTEEGNVQSDIQEGEPAESGNG